MNNYELAFKQLLCLDDIMQRTQEAYDKYVSKCKNEGYGQTFHTIGSFTSYHGLFVMPSLNISNLTYVSNVLIFKVKKEYEKLPRVKMELTSKQHSMFDLADTLTVSIISNTNGLIDQIEIPLECYLWDIKEQTWRLNGSGRAPVQANSEECREYFKELSEKIFGYIHLFVDC